MSDVNCSFRFVEFCVCCNMMNICNQRCNVELNNGRMGDGNFKAHETRVLAIKKCNENLSVSVFCFLFHDLIQVCGYLYRYDRLILFKICDLDVYHGFSSFVPCSH